jgi:hypothetical protein
LLYPSVGNYSFGNYSFISSISAPIANASSKAEGQTAGFRAMRDVNNAALREASVLRRTIWCRHKENLLQEIYLTRELSLGTQTVVQLNFAVIDVVSVNGAFSSGAYRNTPAWRTHAR